MCRAGIISIRNDGCKVHGHHIKTSSKNPEGPLGFRVWFFFLCEHFCSFFSFLQNLGDPRSCVCQAPNAFICVSPCGSILGPFWVHFGSILGPFWVHFGSILGPFWVHFGSILGPFCLLSECWLMHLVHSMFCKECSLDKNSSLDCYKNVRAKRAKASERSELRCVPDSADALRTHLVTHIQTHFVTHM